MVAGVGGGTVDESVVVAAQLDELAQTRGGVGLDRRGRCGELCGVHQHLGAAVGRDVRQLTGRQSPVQGHEDRAERGGGEQRLDE